jgi:long-chain acyl-CoA synthetase
MFVGGAPVYVEDLKRAIALFGAEKLWILYGQGEAPMTLTHLPPHLFGEPQSEEYESRLGSVGIARTGVAIRVLTRDGADAPLGEIGEVAARGDVVMAGYWNNWTATTAAIPDAWLRTGDLGMLDESGFLTLVDRSKDMIISGGSNIYPREIEEVLLTHPLVKECAVIGTPDPQWGETPLAFVVPCGDAPSAAELDALCLDHLARFKRPRAYRFVDELPKSAYGKILKSSLRAQVS